jgi:hypothetical protein
VIGFVMTGPCSVALAQRRSCPDAGDMSEQGKLARGCKRKRLAAMPGWCGGRLNLIKVPGRSSPARPGARVASLRLAQNLQK